VELENNWPNNPSFTQNTTNTNLNFM